MRRLRNPDGGEPDPDARTRQTPVLVISALDDDESRAKATEAGATAYYTKPFSAIALLKEIERLVGAKS